jgi:hypothetical protein
LLYRGVSLAELAVVTRKPGEWLRVTGQSHCGRGERASLAAVNGSAFTGWAEGLPRPPSLASVPGAGSEAPATKVVPNVSLASPLSLGGSNALGYAWGCGRHDRTMSGLGLVWSKAEGSNCAHSSSNQNFTHGGLLPKEGLRALANRYLILHLIHDACVRGLRLPRGAANSYPARLLSYLCRESDNNHEENDNNHEEEEKRLEGRKRGRLSLSADRCENQGAE